MSHVHWITIITNSQSRPAKLFQLYFLSFDAGIANIGGVCPVKKVTERKYILDLQVKKYGLLAAVWQEETGRQLKNSKCLVYEGADIAFWHCTDRTDSNGS